MKKSHFTFAISMLLMLVSCGGGSSSVTSENATRSGYAVDDYVIGGKVSISSLSSGAVVYETTTGDKGVFQWPQSLSGAVRIEITGGNEDYDGLASTTNDQKPFDGTISALLYAEKQSAPLIVSAITTGLTNSASGDITKYESAKNDLPTDISNNFFISAADSQSDIGEKLEAVKKTQRAIGFSVIVREVSDDGSLNGSKGTPSESVSQTVSIASQATSPIAAIEDLALRLCIASLINKEPSKVTNDDLLSMTDLTCIDSGISSLRGIGALKNLELIAVPNNDIIDLNYLNSLSKLYYIDVTNNNIKSFSSLNSGSFSSISVQADKNCAVDDSWRVDSEKIKVSQYLKQSSKQYKNCLKNDADVRRLTAKISGTGAYVLTYIATKNSLASCQIDWGDGNTEQAFCDALSHIVQHAYSSPPINPVKFLVNGAIKAQAYFPGQASNININPIAFQQINSSVVSYSTGLVFWIPRSSSGVYDNATVQGLGTESQTNGVAALKDTGSGTSLSVMQAGGSYSGDVFSLSKLLSVNAIPAGTTYTVRLYKGTTLVATQAIKLAGAVVAPSEMSTTMFPALTLNTYTQLCPNGVKTTASWYALPSNLTKYQPQEDLYCSASSGSGSVEAGDGVNRRFLTSFIVSPPVSAAIDYSMMYATAYSPTLAYWVPVSINPSDLTYGYSNSWDWDVRLKTGAFNINGKKIKFDITSGACRITLAISTAQGMMQFIGDKFQMWSIGSYSVTPLQVGRYELAFGANQSGGMTWNIIKDDFPVVIGEIASNGDVADRLENGDSTGKYFSTMMIVKDGCTLKNFAIQ